jgi:dolichol kinase
MFYVAIKGFNEKNFYGGSSTLLCGLFFIVFSYYNSLIGFFPFPYTGFMVWWIWLLIGSNMSFAILIEHIIKNMELEQEKVNKGELTKQKKTILRNFINLMRRSYNETEISFQMECVRKSFHLSGLLVLIGFFGFFIIPPIAQLINENVILYAKQNVLNYSFFWGDFDDYPYEKGEFRAIEGIMVFGLIGSLIFSITSEFYRILWGPEYSLLNFLTKPILRDKEKNAVGAHIYLITGLIFSYMLYLVNFVHLLVFITGMLIACFSDALAALIGRRCGRNKVKCIGGDIKSVEGFIAGTGSAFIIGLYFLGPIYGLIAAFIFFLLDYFPTIIADNLLNPIVLSIVLSLCIYFIGLPIGWS